MPAAELPAADGSDEDPGPDDDAGQDDSGSDEDPGSEEGFSERRLAWAATLAAGGTVVLAQRRGPAALMFVGAVVLLALELVLLGWAVGSFALSWRVPGLLVITLVTALVFVPFPFQRMVTGGPRLTVDPTGLRYGRFRARWDEIGPVRVKNAQNVEVGERDGRFPLDNRAVAALMRHGLRARGSWLSAWLPANAYELAGWLEAERRARSRRRTQP